MPFARISLNAGQTPAYLAAVSASVHQALVQAFDVPQDDCFQVIHQHAPGELVFDRHYLGGPRSGSFVLIHITAGRTRSAQTKKSFFRRVAEALHESPGIRKEDVMVIISTTGPEDWSFANGEAAA